MDLHSAAELGVRAEMCDERVALEKKNCKENADIEKKYWEDVLRIDRDACQKKISLTKIPWYARPAAVALFSILGTLGVLQVAINFRR
jgi:hypothetical protein